VCYNGCKVKKIFILSISFYKFYLIKSGAGKTTLLNVLNFRNQNKMLIEGEVKLNGQPADWNMISRCSGYVQQDDLFVGTMTVREHLSFLVVIINQLYH